ncbi:MAG: PIN domain-containing protein [Betaproteobacteria bacterium]
MSTAKCFADTNVAIYALDADAAKRTKALAILDGRPFVSTQVVNEYLNVLLVKRRLDRTAAHELARALMAACEVVSVTAGITDLAMNIGERYQLSHWDSLIVAASLRRWRKTARRCIPRTCRIGRSLRADLQCRILL